MLSTNARSLVSPRWSADRNMVVVQGIFDLKGSFTSTLRVCVSALVRVTVPSPAAIRFLTTLPFDSSTTTVASVLTASPANR